MNHRISLACLSVLLLVVGCDGSPPEEDAQVITLPDAGPPPPDPSELFGPCVEDSQCPGAGAICRTNRDGWPGGYCTVPCEDRTPCDYRGVYHHCTAQEGETQTYCERRCLNGIDCGRTGYTCIGMLPPSGGLCIGVCSSDAECGDGTVCDLYSGQCAVTAPTNGALTGEACSGSQSCRSGACLTEAGNGWPGGYCVGNCILPSGFNTSTFYNGDSLPRGTCAGDAICLPVGSQAEGDLGTCYDQCVDDGDCRTGYGCLKDFQLGSGGVSSYDNGVCVPAG
jgi:hypothetical protein